MRPAGVDLEERLELLAERRGDNIVLLSPGVGLFAGARPPGDLVTGGTAAGTLVVLGRAHALVVPEGVEGRIAGTPPALARRPVAWGDVLYEVVPYAAAEGIGRSGGKMEAAGPASDTSNRGLFLSPGSGRFYLRPSPAEEPYAAPGALIEDGQPIGLLEVMKTFAHVRYVAGGSLPRRARVVRVLVEDGAEVGAGDPLLQVEPAGE